MTRIALAVGIAWGLAAVVVWAWVRAATRPVPAHWREDDVQPVDPYPASLTATHGSSVTVTLPGQTLTYASGGSRDWRN